MKAVDATFQYASVEETANELGMTPGRIRQLLRSDDLHGRKVGDTWVIPALEIQRFKRIPKRTGRPRTGDKPQ
jgi:hypothetical protein